MAYRRADVKPYRTPPSVAGAGRIWDNLIKDRKIPDWYPFKQLFYI